MTSILLIDDDTSFRTSLKKLLEREGYEVTEGVDGHEGFALIQKSHYDVVILDILMPNKDGIELINDLRRIQSKIKIIAISGGGQIRAEDHLQSAKILGADRVIKKPFSSQEIFGAINSVSTH